MIAGKTAEFINRHVYPPSPNIQGLNIHPTLIQSEPVVKSNAVSAERRALMHETMEGFQIAEILY